jgi:hypothetical protein
VIAKVLAGLLLVAVIAALWLRGDVIAAKARADGAEKLLANTQVALSLEQNARAEERAASGRMAAIGTDHEDRRSEAEKLPAAIAAGLDDGTIRLRRQWAACETSRLSESAVAAAERDALAELRRKDQGDLVRAGRDADDQVRACQAVIDEYRFGGLTSRDGAKP